MRRYPKSRRTAKQRVERAKAQETSLLAYLSEPAKPSTPTLRGIGVVTPKPRVRASKPKYVRGNTSYIAANGARIAIEPTPLLEVWKDAYRNPATKRPNAPKAATVTPAPKANLRAIAQSNVEARLAD
jgi:hypothetical protein